MPSQPVLESPLRMWMTFAFGWSMAFVKTWRSPVLLIQGDDDRSVQFNQTVMLADALDKLLADSQLRNRLARAARANVEKRFTIDRSARQLLTLFQGGGDASFV